MPPEVGPPPVFRTKDSREVVTELVRLGQSRQEARKMTDAADEHGYCEDRDGLAYVYRGGLGVDDRYYEVGGDGSDAA